MASANIISILITAKDEASAVLKTTAASVDATASSISKAGATLAGTGATLTKNITVPMAAVAIASAKMAYDFENKMELLHTSAGIAQSAIAGLSNQILQMAGQVGQAPEALAEGLYHVASAGNGIWNTAQMMDILRVAAEGANLGLANLDTTTYSLTSAMASNIKGAKDASEMMATLTAIVGAGDMKMEDLNAALSTGILSTAATFGISIQSVGAALATLTDNGEHADEAATRLRMTLALMTSPSTVAAKQLGALGLTAEDAKNATADMNKVFVASGLTTTKLADDLRQPNGITVAMRDLQTHLESAGLSASEADAILSRAFGGGRTDAALLTMLQNLDRLDAKYQTITKGAGQFQQKMADLNNTAPQQFRQAWSQVESSLTKLGEAVLPQVSHAFSVLAQWLTDISKWYSSLSKGQKQLVVDLALVTAALGPVLVILGSMARSITSIIALDTVLGTRMAATGTEASASALVMSGAMTKVKTAYAATAAFVSTPMALGALNVAAALASIGMVIKAIQAAQGAFKAWDQANAAAAELDKVKKQTAAAIDNKVKSGSISLGQAYSIQQSLKDNPYFNQKVSKNGNTFTVGFASGGFTGRGSSTDVAGVVHKGEYVLPKSAVDQTTGKPKSFGDTIINITGPVNFKDRSDIDYFAERISKVQRLAAVGMA